jgi:uncharacterized phage-like protein YoqJ
MIIAGTGHRPQFCPCGFDENHPWIESLKERIKLNLIDKKAHVVVSGCAIGFDTWLAEVALELNIHLRMYVPFKGQSSNWPEAARKKYRYLLDNAAIVYQVSEHYSKDAFLKRDRAMVDDCDEVFALLDPNKTSGGTYYTVKYAKQHNKIVTNLW